MDPSSAETCRRVARFLALLSLVGAMASLVGWATDTPLLADWDLDGVAQVPNAAIAIAAASLAAILALSGMRRSAIALAAVPAAIGGATLFEHIAGVDLGIDALVFYREWGQRGTVAPGRMGPPAAFSSVVVGLSVILGSFRNTRRLASAGGALTTTIAILSLIGYIYQSDPLFAVPRLTTVALQTSVMLLTLGLALMASVPDLAPARFLLGPSASAAMIRRILPATIVIPVFLGWARDLGQDAGLFDSAFGTAILVLTLIFVQAGLLLWAAGAVSRQEAETEREAEKFALLFHKASYAVSLSTLDGGVIVDVNDAFARTFGLRREEAIGRTAHEIGLVRDTAGAAPFVEQFGRERSLSDVELSLETPRGTRVFLSNASVIEFGGKPHLLATLQDITERKAGEEALRESAVALQEADRMKDEFLATLSHELRTPLTSIVGWAHLLLNGDLDERERQMAIQAIGSSARAQTELVEDVLDVSRIVTGKMRIARRDVNLANIVEMAVGALRPAAEAKRISVAVSIDGSLPRYFVDPERMQQVVWNLLSNAIKFSPHETSIDVELRGGADGAFIVVTDRGRGIDPGFMPHVFERFRQEDSSSSRPHSGLGIGLALTKDLVELHGGTISVESQLGRGSRFTVHLPPPADVPLPESEHPSTLTA